MTEHTCSICGRPISGASEFGDIHQPLCWQCLSWLTQEYLDQYRQSPEQLVDEIVKVGGREQWDAWLG